MSGKFYQIYLRNISVDASIGIHDFERAKTQQLRVSVVLLLREPGSAEDHIEHVTDYDFVREVVSREVSRKHWELQEALCRSIAKICLDTPDVLGVVVRTEKPTVYPDTDAVGCRIAALGDELPSDFAWWTLDV